VSLWDDRRSAGFPIMLCAEHGAATGLRELALPERPSGPAAPTSLTGPGTAPPSRPPRRLRCPYPPPRSLGVKIQLGAPCL